MADDLDRQGAELVVFTVGECLRRSYDNALAGMDAQWVEILHVAHGDAIVVPVAHNFIFNLFPSFKALLDEYLWRERESLLAESVELCLVVGKTRAQTSKGIGCTHDDRVAQVGSGLVHLLNVLTSLTLDGLYVDLIQTLHKKLAVFCVHDGLDGCAKNADIILLKNTVLIELDAAVESCLAAEG